MFELLPLPKLLEEWHRWAKWVRDPHRDETLAGELVGWQEFNWAVESQPELAWQAILAALVQPRVEAYLGTLAAGPLEDLLCAHGETFIDRIEVEAQSNPKFASLLSGVWRSTMPEHVWHRVQPLAIHSN
jgi:hypothetical protein